MQAGEHDVDRAVFPSATLVAPLLAALLAALHALSYWGAGPVDDDYIVHRYAANLLAGHGFVFNPGGEAAEGFTSPLWLAVSLAVQTLDPMHGASLEDAVRGLGVAASALTAWVVARAAGRAHRAAWGGFAVAASPAFAFHAVAGLGTVFLALFLALFATSWLVAERRQAPPVGAGLWLALACSTRQEAVLLWLPFLVVVWRRGQPLAALPAGLVLLGWTVARLVWFGRLDPVTHAVKRLPLAAELDYGLDYLWSSTLDALVVVALGAALAVVCDRRVSGVWRALGAGVVVHGLYVVLVGGDWMPLARFYVPVLPVGFLLVGAACESRLVPSARPAAWAVVLIGLQIGQRERAQVLFDHGFFEERWVALGEHFRRHAPPGTRVALSPIGAFGQRSRLPIVDLLGLTHTRLLGVAPDLEGVRMKGHHRHDAEWVLADPPEFMVLGNGVVQPDTGRLAVNPWERDIVADPRFAARYVHVRAEVDGAPMEWFRRRDVVPFAGESLR
jgi:arabinofuranosyltransferase